MKKVLALMLVLCCMVGLFAGCSSDNPPDDSNNTNTDNKTNTENKDTNKDSENKDSNTSGKDTVNVAVGGNPVTFDPMMTNNGIDQMMGIAILSTIVEFDTDGTIIPNVATEWEIAEDGLTYTFKLRDDVKFSNGDDLTASDVVFSVNRALGSNYLKTDWGTYVESAEATGDYEVVIHMKEPYAPFMALCAKMLYIHDEDYYNAYIAEGHTDEEYQMNPIGSGPFKFVSYDEGVEVCLDSNELYFKGEPAIKHLNFVIVADENARAVAVQNGDLDLIGIFTSVPNSQIATLEAAENVTVMESAPTKVIFMPLNCEQEGYSDPRVRQAISYAIDYDYVISVGTNGKGTRAYCSLLGPNTFGYTEEGTEYDYDKEKALELLAEAGYPNGEGLGVMKATIRAGMKGVVEAVQACLADVGIKMETDVMEDGVYMAEVRKGNFTTSAIGLLCNVDAAINDSFLHADGIGAMNFARYVNPTVMENLEKAAACLDPVERQGYYDIAYGIIKDEAPYIPLYYEPQFFIYTTGLNLGPIYPNVSLIKYENLSWD